MIAGRGFIGMAAEAMGRGNPYLAAKLAAYDSVISHSNNGLIGGVFNAVLVSLAFIEKDMKKLAVQAVGCMPKESEFYSVLEFSLKACEAADSWEDAFA